MDLDRSIHDPYYSSSHANSMQLRCRRRSEESIIYHPSKRRPRRRRSGRTMATGGSTETTHHRRPPGRPPQLQRWTVASGPVVRKLIKTPIEMMESDREELIGRNAAVAFSPRPAGGGASCRPQRRYPSSCSAMTSWTRQISPATLLIASYRSTARKQQHVLPVPRAVDRRRPASRRTLASCSLRQPQRCRQSYCSGPFNEIRASA